MGKKTAVDSAVFTQAKLMGLKIFVDFDGTITTEDVGNGFFLKFGGPRCSALVREYRAGEISAVECFRREAEALGFVNKTEADQFFKAQPVDRGFKDFVLFCKEQGIDVAILSDGLDYYIREILEANDIRDVPFFANHAEFIPENGMGYKLHLRFPYTDAECTRCACCKRNILLTRSGEEDILAYVGEGYSDTCPAQYADIVFAKDHLQSFCQRENITYYPYANFHDVIERLRTLSTDGKRFRKRRRAELRRREAFLRE